MATVITINSFRVPKLFIVLCACVVVVTWFGINSGLHRSPLAVPTIAALDETAIQEATVGQKVPDFTLTDTSGRTHSLSGYEGRPVILYFWASWCPYCMEGMPALGLLQDSYQDDGLVVLAVNILEEPANVQAAVRPMDLSYPLLLDETGVVTRSFVVRAIPTYVFIDRSGIYKDTIIGSARQGHLESKIEAILAPLPN